MPMTPLKKRLDVLIWVLIFGGLLVAVLGFASHKAAPAAGWSLMVGGGGLAAAGAVLVWVRSRLGPDK